MTSHDQAYSPEEAQRRFEQALKAAVTTPPAPMKDRSRGADAQPDRQAVGKALAPKRKAGTAKRS